MVYCGNISKASARVSSSRGKNLVCMHCRLLSSSFRSVHGLGEDESSRFGSPKRVKEDALLSQSTPIMHNTETCWLLRFSETGEQRGS